MIIDLQTRAWSSPEQLGRVAAEQLRQRDSGRWLRLDPTPGELARTMECVSAIFLLGFRSERLGASIPMEFVAEQVRRHPGQIVGIAGIDPLAADPREQIDRARSLGLSGLSLSPSASGFHPTHSAAMRTYELAERHGLPIFVSRPTPLSQSCSMEFDRPLAWDEVCRAFPRLRLVLGGLGHPWIGETLVLLSKHQHVHADLAGVISRPWQLYNALLEASALGVLGKLLFASGFPMETPARAIETLYSVNSFAHGTPLPSIPRTSLRSIVERNPLEPLGIEFECLPPRPAAPSGSAGAMERTANTPGSVAG